MKINVPQLLREIASEFEIKRGRAESGALSVSHHRLCSDYVHYLKSYAKAIEEENFESLPAPLNSAIDLTGHEMAAPPSKATDPSKATAAGSVRVIAVSADSANPQVLAGALGVMLQAMGSPVDSKEGNGGQDARPDQ